MSQAVRRDGSTGGGHKPVWSLAEEREPFVPGRRPEGRGFRLRRTPQSHWTVVELDIQADPRKTPEWAAEMEATIGKQRFQREYLRNWTLSTQSPFYPEYLARGGDDFFVREVASLGRGPLLLGLDFGVRHPAVVAAQANARKTRLYLIREWMPTGIMARPFLEVVCWLVGQMHRDELAPEALVHVLDLERRADLGKGPTVPWFRHAGQVLRYSSHEALRTAQEVASESRERRIVDIWEAAGFPLSIHHAQVKGGADVVRHLLRKPPEGILPYLVVDKWCQLLREGFGGGYTFKRPSREDPMPSEPTKDGYYEHTQDDVRYIASQAIDMKAVDDGTPDERDPVKPVAAETRNAGPKVQARDVYSRGDLEDNSEGCSTPWGTSSRNDVYERWED